MSGNPNDAYGGIARGHGEPSAEFIDGAESERLRNDERRPAYRGDHPRPRVNDVLLAIERMDAQQMRSFARRFERRGLGKIIWSEDGSL